MALRGLENDGLTSAEELVLYASPYLALPFYSCGAVERLSSPCVEIAFALHGEGMISYLTSYSYRLACVHLLVGDWVPGLVLFDNKAFCLYGRVTLYPSQHFSTATPPTPSTFLPPYLYYSRTNLLYW